MLSAPPIDEPIRSLIRLAVDEDLQGSAPESQRGDQTVRHSIPPTLRATGTIVPRRAGVISGTFLIQAIVEAYAPPEMPHIEIRSGDGARVNAGDAVAVLSGPAGVLLSAERVLLNFLCHLSGIATLTRKFVDAVATVQPPPAICDTRKTTPGLRALDKYAVRCGGGVNHRMGLYDGVMLKDNHLAALRQRLGHGMTLAQLTAQVRGECDRSIPLWLEVDTLDQLREALAGPTGSPGADIILLDNFSQEEMRQAVHLRENAAARPGGAKPLLEASGGITLDNVLAVARTGVDRMSIGALTHSAPTLDLSMELTAQGLAQKA